MTKIIQYLSEIATALPRTMAEGTQLYVARATYNAFDHDIDIESDIVEGRVVYTYTEGASAGATQLDIYVVSDSKNFDFLSEFPFESIPREALGFGDIVPKDLVGVEVIGTVTYSEGGRSFRATTQEEGTLFKRLVA